MAWVSVIVIGQGLTEDPPPCPPRSHSSSSTSCRSSRPSSVKIRTLPATKPVAADTSAMTPSRLVLAAIGSGMGDRVEGGPEWRWGGGESSAGLCLHCGRCEGWWGWECAVRATTLRAAQPQLCPRSRYHPGLASARDALGGERYSRVVVAEGMGDLHEPAVRGEVHVHVAQRCVCLVVDEK